MRHPIPSTDPADPRFEPRRYWRGPVWAVVNWMLAEERRVALVVGNAGYKHLPHLENTVSDARLMAWTLQSVGFQLIDGKVQIDLDRRWV